MTLVIAEAGVNHDGSTDKAVSLVEAAHGTGAAIVKFQTFRADALATAAAPKAEYQTRATAGSSQLGMLQKLELSRDGHRAVLDRCTKLGIEFLSSPFDVESLRFLVDECGVRRLKLGSGEITNAPLLLAAAKTGIPLIVSTGMSTLADVENALGVIAFGRYAGSDRPSRAAFRAAFRASNGGRDLAGAVTLLHCVSQYPAPASEVNLRAMETMRVAFGVPVGFSDHTEGVAVAVAAVALGAAVIEKHLTLDRRAEGPDHAASMEPLEFTALVRAIREAESALGNGAKVPVPSERDTARVARRGVVAKRAIARGAKIELEDLDVKRPEAGPSPLDLWDLAGKTAAKDHAPDEPIEV